MAKQVLEFFALHPKQSKTAQVFCFVARAQDVFRVARIERAGRDQGGTLTGFQRPQIAGHIREIRDYLEKPSAILPNAIILGFTSGAKLRVDTQGVVKLTIDITNGPPGWVVDGQQRFTALGEMDNPNFEILVSGFICPTLEELQKQFILINNTRPLPKALVYELLPQVGDLPLRLSSRAQAAFITEALNYASGSSLKGLIKQQTNPKGIIADTVIQRVIMNSISDGALRLYAKDNKLLIEAAFELFSEFFHAVQHVFHNDWKDHTPKTSRLLHGTGIIAMGYAMETLITMTGARNRTQFADGLRHLIGKTAWTDGKWTFGDEVRRWNSLQNVPQDVRQLSLHLMQTLKRGLSETQRKTKRVRG